MRGARVRAPLVAEPSLVVPPTGLRDPTDIALEFEKEFEEAEEEEEEVLEMCDESTDRFEHSRFRARRLCVHCAPVPQRKVEVKKGSVQQTVAAPTPQTLGNSWQVCRSYQRERMLACPFLEGNC